MRMRHEIGVRTEQRLGLAPKMLQSIEVLQLANAELAQRIASEAESNEVLELGSREVELPELDAPTRRPDEDAIPVSPRPAHADDPKLAFLSSLPAPEAGLVDVVRDQLAMLDLTEDLSAAVLSLVQRLDEHGWLQIDEDEIASVCGAECGAQALDVLRELEPRGLGARGPIDAMLAQVDASDPDRDLIERLLNDHLDSLSRNKIPDVARALELELEDVEALLQRVAALDPRPAEAVTSDVGEPVSPDLVVTRECGELRVIVADQELPILGLDESYCAMARAPETDVEVRDYLREKVRSARDLIRAVDQRRLTLARIGVAVFAHQRRFLDQGPSAILPLKMADIAVELELHPSTISRAIAGKWVQTDIGVFQLRRFFDGARGGAAAGGSAEGAGRMAVQERVRELFAGEDASQPISDEEAVERLAEAGIRVARRTIAKYRRELGIPSSWRRRRYGVRDRK